MDPAIRVGGLYRLIRSKNWKTEPFGIICETKKQSDLKLNDICLVLQLTPNWDTPVSKLWVRVLVGDKLWDIHSDFLEPVND